MGYNTMMASSTRRPPISNEVKRINIVHSVTKNVLNMANSASSADPSCSVFFVYSLYCFMSKSTAMVTTGWSVHLTTLFPG